MTPAPSNFIRACTAEGDGVQNLGLVVQNCTKWVQNYGTIFRSRFENGGAICFDLALQIWFACTAGEKGVQNLEFVVQNCTKNVQNYGNIFRSSSKMVGLHASSPSPPPEIWFSTAGGERVQNLGLIVQNDDTILRFKFEHDGAGGMDLIWSPG